MIPEDHKTAIVSSGLTFMRSITEAYGADEGMALWNTIASTLDPDVKGQIFFAMVTGSYYDSIILKRVGPNTDRVARIKEIRNWTGYGLKEAKDASDRVATGMPVTLKVKPEEHTRAIIGLRQVGFEI